MNKKLSTLKRLENISSKAKEMKYYEIKKIIRSMKNEDLKVLVNENTTNQQISEIWERAKNECKSKIAEKA